MSAKSMIENAFLHFIEKHKGATRKKIESSLLWKNWPSKELPSDFIDSVLENLLKQGKIKKSGRKYVISLKD
jgi:hypothetical protein